MALACTEAPVIEIEALTSSFRVKALNGTILVTLRIHLNMSHDLGPGLDDRRNSLTEVQDHLGSSVAEGICEFPHELIPLAGGLLKVFLSEFLKVLNDVLDLLIVDLDVVGELVTLAWIERGICFLSQ